MKDNIKVKSQDDSKNTEKSEKLDMDRYKDYVVPKEIVNNQGSASILN